MSENASVASTVKELWEMGWSLRRIAAQLQADGIPAPRRGGRWTHTAVKRILDRARETSSTESPSTPAPESPHAPVGVMGSVTITTSGTVTIAATGDVATTGPVTVTPTPAAHANPAPSASLKGSRIILAGPSTPLPFSPPRELTYALPLSPDAALMLSDPLFLRRRV